MPQDMETTNVTTVLDIDTTLLTARLKEINNFWENVTLIFNEGAKKADDKGKGIGKGLEAGMKIASSSLRSFEKLTPGFLGTVAEIVEQISEAQSAIQEMTNSAAKWGTGIAAALGIGATIVCSVIQQMQDAEEKRQKAFEEGVKNNQRYAENLTILKTHLDIMQDENATVDQVRTARQALADTFPDLILGLNEEGEAILANNKALQQYQEIQKREFSNSRTAIIVNSQGVEESFLESKKKYDELVEKYARYQEQVGEHTWNDGKKVMVPIRDQSFWDIYAQAQTGAPNFEYLDTTYKNLNAAETEYLENAEKMQIVWRAQIENAVTATDAITGLTVGWEGLDNIQSLVANSIYLNSLKSLREGNSTWHQVADEINKVLDDPAQMQKYEEQLKRQTAATEEQARISQILTDVYGQEAASTEQLAAAYKSLTNGAELSDAQLQKLAQTYPQIKEYIQETNDLTLDSGRIITEVMSSIDYSEQLGELDNLAAAYERLAGGQQLSAGQIYELAMLYPEVAQYIAATNDLTLQEGEILQTVYGIRRAATIEQLKDNQTAAEEQVKSTKTIIQSIEQEINALVALYTAHRIPDSVYYTQSQALKAELKEQEEFREKQLQNAQAAKALIEALDKPLTFSGSSGNKSSVVKSTRNEALANELKLLDQKKKMDQLTSAEELKQLERIQKSYRMNADEKADLEYRIYALKKQMAEEEEKANTERLNAEYKAIENKKSLGEMSAKEELRRLEEIQRTFVKNKEEEIELEIKIYNLKKELRDEDIESLNTLGDAVTEALRGQYEKQKEAEEERIQDSIDSWQQWEEDTVSAIQGQLNALDELEKQQEEADRQAEYQRKKEAAELALAYEKDAYNRQQMQKELNRIEEEERKRREAVERENERERLRQEMEAVKNDSQKHQDALQEELDGLSKTYDELMSDFNLRAEAEKLILKSSQDQLVELIRSYAPQYDLLGQSFGEKLVDGFKSKVGDIEAYFQSIQQRISAYQDNLAYTANAAADRFWQDRAQYEQKLSGQSAPAAAKRDVTMIVNFNQPVESPIEIRRQLNRAAEDFARRIGG